MGKVTWGISADTIDNAKVTDFEPYDGPVPPNGVYGVQFKKVTAETTSTNKPMIKVLAVIDGSIGEGKKEYDGCPIWDNVVVSKETDWKVKQFLAGIGATSKEFITATVTDKEGNITKIGTVTFGENKRFRIQTKKGKDQDGNVRPEIRGYLAPGQDVKGSRAHSLDDEPEPDFDEEHESEADGDEEEGWTYDDIAELDLDELKALIEEYEVEVKVLRKDDADSLRAKVAEALEIEAAEDEEPEEDEEEEAEEDDLDSLDRDGLKAYIKENGLEVRVLKNDTEDSLREKIRATLDEDEDEDEPAF